MKFNPAEWLDLAESAGMEYLVFTAKHHDGFCMWNTRGTDYNVMNTPYRRDVLGMLADECHKRAFPLVLYYSAVDWHQPNYPNLGRHHEITTDPAGHDMDAYMDFLKCQIRELCSNYGTIHGFWWDMNVPQHVDRSVNEMIRSLQPLAVINNRGYDEGDFSTPERNFQEDATIPFATPTEACESVGVNSWGYCRRRLFFGSTVFTVKSPPILRSRQFSADRRSAPDGTFSGNGSDSQSIGKWYPGEFFA